MTKRVAIILAGGKAQRFQTAQGKWQDKALAELYGKPLLVHAIENVKDVVDEIVIVVNENETRMPKYNDVLARFNVENARIITDIKIDHLSGPIVAILTGLKSVDEDYCLIVPCDMPLLQPNVADYLFNEINGSYVAVPMWPNGRLETLLVVLERYSTLKIASVLCHLGRSHPDDIIRGALQVLFVSPLGEIKALDPELKSFVNINSQEDLSRLQPRPGQGPVVENLRLNLGDLPIDELQRLQKASSERKNSDFSEAAKLFSACAVNLEKENSFFWAAVSRESEGKSWRSGSKQLSKPELINHGNDALLKAASNYGLEAEMYEQNRCYLLAERAKADKSWCESQVKRLSTTK
jgi:molybdopterin-guanine dinucleotide biosynthesis protein A